MPVNLRTIYSAETTAETFGFKSERALILAEIYGGVFNILHSTIPQKSW